MKLLRKLWARTCKEKFAGRVVTIGCTLLTSYTVTVENPPPSFAWLIGILNGFLIVMELAEEFEEG